MWVVSVQIIRCPLRVTELLVLTNEWTWMVCKPSRCDYWGWLNHCLTRQSQSLQANFFFCLLSYIFFIPNEWLKSELLHPVQINPNLLILLAIIVLAIVGRQNLFHNHHDLHESYHMKVIRQMLIVKA